MKHHDFTILIPAFNAEKWIAQTLSSLIAQTYKKWQALVINDGSTDDTLKIVKSYAGLDKRFLYTSKVNGGTASALNIGVNYFLKKRNGSFLMWLSADDLYTVDALACHNYFINLNAVRDTEFYFHASNYHLIREKDNTGLLMNDSSDWMHVPDKEYQIAKFILQGNYIHGNSIALSYDLVERLGHLNNTLPFAHDMEYWLRASMLTNIKFMDIKTTITRRHSLQTGSIYKEIKYFDPARIVFDQLSANTLSDFFKSNIAVNDLIEYCAKSLVKSPLRRLPFLVDLDIKKLSEYCLSCNDAEKAASFTCSSINRNVKPEVDRRFYIRTFIKYFNTPSLHQTTKFVDMLKYQLNSISKPENNKLSGQSIRLVELYLKKVEFQEA